MVGSAEPVNGFLCLKTKKMYVLLHETVGSTEPTDGFLDPAMQETLVLLHETEGYLQVHAACPRRRACAAWQKAPP